MRRTAAWPLTTIYVALVVYASLFPFSGWRDQGDVWWAFLIAPWPRYWTWFDLLTNLAGYVPMGFLLALALLRSSGWRSGWLVVAGCAFAGSVLSLLMETLQQHLPTRVPSNVDWLANSLGALLGSTLAWVLERWGWIARWSRLRSRWFADDAHLAIALLMLWPLALLFPAPVTLGLGQVLERLHRALAQSLADTPWLEWLPSLENWDQVALSPLAEMLVVATGLWVPVLLAYSIIGNWLRRIAALGVLAVLAVGVTVLSTVLSFGPVHAWVWVEQASKAGLVLALVLGAISSVAAPRVVLSLALVAGLMGLSLVNQAPNNAYFAQNLAAWEQGRFVRFHGLAQWLGWLWPYAALWHVFMRLVRR